MAENDQLSLLREMLHDLTLIRNDQARLEESLLRLRGELTKAVSAMDLLAQTIARLHEPTVKQSLKRWRA